MSEKSKFKCKSETKKKTKTMCSKVRLIFVKLESNKMKITYILISLTNPITDYNKVLRLMTLDTIKP